MDTTQTQTKKEGSEERFFELLNSLHDFDPEHISFTFTPIPNSLLPQPLPTLNPSQIRSPAYYETFCSNSPYLKAAIGVERGIPGETNRVIWLKEAANFTVGSL